MPPFLLCFCSASSSYPFAVAQISSWMITRSLSKFPKFLKAVALKGIKEGSIIEIKVTTADGENFDSNLKVGADDMELVEQMKNLFGGM